MHILDLIFACHQKPNPSPETVPLKHERIDNCSHVQDAEIARLREELGAARSKLSSWEESMIQVGLQNNIIFYSFVNLSL
jgi:hypothetical protein